MNEIEFIRNMHGASEMSNLSNAGDICYWSGYIEGLLRLHHGDSGTSEEHNQALASAQDTNYPERRKFGAGYICGFTGVPVADAIDRLARYKSASHRGSAKKPKRRK